MSREKLNIQFRIRAVDNFSKTMNKLHVRLENVKRHVESLDDMKTVEVNVVGDAKAKRDIKKVNRAADKLERKNIVMLVKADVRQAWGGFRGLMSRIAHLSRDASELFTSMFGSAIMASAPALAASLYSVVGVVGALGPMVGALSGGILGLASAFGAAGVAAVGFGALAFSSLSKVFEVNSELKDLQKELADTTDAEERVKILKAMEEATNGLSKEQQRALKSVQKLSNTWGKLSKRIEPQVITTFTNSLGALESVLSRLTPMIDKTAKVSEELSESLKLNIKSKDFEAFVKFLNQSAAPILKDITEGLGNFTMGILNVLTAFGPLAEDVARGFNNMGREFRDWAAGLTESKKFQAFVDYVREEAPKLLSIFGGIITGLTDLFAAFGPLASEMLDGLLEMVGGFKDWAATLDENQSFQEFIEFIRTNGPQVLEFFGEFREFLLHVIDGFARASEEITPLITNLLEFANTFLEANPRIMEFVAWVTALAGVAMLVLVPLRLMWAILRMLISPIITLVMWIGNKLTPILAAFWGFIQTKLIPWLGKLWGVFLRALPVIGRVIGAALRLLGPWALVGLAAFELYTLIRDNWDAIWAKTKEIFGKVKDWVTTKIAEVVATGVIIWGWIKGIIGYFKDLWDGVKKRMSDVGTAVTDGWNTVMEFLSGIDLFEIGANIMEGLKNGIVDAGKNVIKSVKGVVDDAITGAKKLLGIASPSKVFRQFGIFTGEGFVIGMDKMRTKVSKASERMTGASIPKKKSKNFQGINTKTAPYRGFRASTPEDNDSARYDDEARYTVEVPVYLNGREIAKASADDITRIQERKEKRHKKLVGEGR